MSAELQSHIEMLADRHVAAGMSPAEARNAALREFGGVEQIKEQCRDERGITWLENIWRDVSLAGRGLTRSPAFTILAVVIIAAGIAFSTAAFSVANTLLYRALPYPHGDELVRVMRVSRQSAFVTHSPATYFDLKQHASALSGVAVFTRDEVPLGGAGQVAEQVSKIAATADFFDVLQVRPALGRLFRADDNQPGADHVVVLCDRLWRRRFAADPDIVGKSVRIDGEPNTIIGVLGPDFECLTWGSPEVVQPFTLWPNFRSDRKGMWTQLVARLRTDKSIDEANAELVGISAVLNHDYPETGVDSLRLESLYGSNIGPAPRLLLWLLTATAILVLIIGCINLAGLQFARALRRQREFSVRAALGASRWRLMFPVLAESALLAVAGGVVAAGATRLLCNRLESLFARNTSSVAITIAIDAHVAIFAAGAVVLATIAFGLAPAFVAARQTTADALKQSSQATTPGRRTHRFRSALVISQLALSLLVISLAASFKIASEHYFDRDVGWEVEGLMNGALALPYSRYPNDASVRSFQDRLLAGVRALPGVESAALTRTLPIAGVGDIAGVTIPGQAPLPRGQEPLAFVLPVSAGYFATAGIPLKAGRTFPEHAGPAERNYIVISEGLAKRAWPGRDAVGQRLQLTTEETPLEVIGVVGDVRSLADLGPPRASFHIYRSVDEYPLHFIRLAVRVQHAPDTVIPEVRRVVAQIDPDLAVQEAINVKDALNRNSPFHVVNISFGWFAAMAFGIALLGVYATLEQTAAQRSRDFGIRVALGARARDVASLVMRQGAVLTLVGGGTGCAIAVALIRLLRSRIPELGLPGAGIEIVIVGAVLTISLAASVPPALRAARVDPVITLRAE